MNKSFFIPAGLLAVLIASNPLQAGLSDMLDKLKGGVTGKTPDSTAAMSALSNDEMISGLKEALGKGTQYAVDNLGKEGGFLDNASVRIPMPKSLSWVEKTLRTLRQDKLADEFVASMNHAAERAAPEAAAVFGDAIQQMTLEDAQGILSGPDDAATQYFRRTTSATLTEKMRPIVEEATAATGVTSSYKNMMSKAGGMTSLLSSDATDLDGYVTEKTLDGLFLMVAEEEKRIRQNPLARSTDLLKKVFGSL
ncbi:MAG TPA: DUF4197 domain-containing protein [Gammaproteobacteria bacterium]|nr:DUF4197 domain-containing protein [Gammaproteobacteria bacterium]